MHQHINNNANCRPRKFLFGNLKRIASENRSSHLRAENNMGAKHIRGRGGREERENKAWQREKERLESAAVLQLNLYFGILFHRAFVYDCLPPLACELLKDQDHAFFLYPQPPAQVGEKKLRGEVRKNLRSIYYV